MTHAFWRLEQQKEFRRQAAQERKNRYKNNAQKKKETAARKFVQKLPKAPTAGTVERVSPEEFAQMDEQQRLRGLNWWGGSATSDAYSSSVLVDPSQYYDKWAQAYRMLGGFIDCDHSKSGDSHDNGENNNNNQQQDGEACSRWMMWAAVRFVTD